MCLPPEVKERIDRIDGDLEVMDSIILNLNSSSGLKLGKDNDFQNIARTYLIIEISNLIEVGIKDILNSFCSGGSPTALKNYFDNSLKKRSLGDFEQIKKFLGSFDNQWKISFNNKINTAQKENLNNVRSTRNNLAHGRTDEMTYETAKQQYENCKEVINIVNNIINPCPLSVTAPHPSP